MLFRRGLRIIGRAAGKLVASDVTVLVLKEGHWLMEENREETMAALTRFLT